MKRRGVSQVIYTIIMIVFVLVAVGIVWGVIQNIISENVEDISLESLTLDVEIQSVKIEDENITVSVKRDVGKGNLTGILFVFFDGKNSESQEIKISLKELETGSFTFTLDQLNISEIKTISVAPIYNSNSGKDVVRSVTYVYEVGPNQITEQLPEEVPGPENVTCNYENSVVFETNITITNNCVINGDLTIRSNAVVEVDYDSGENSSFIVHGNVNVEDNSKLQIHGTKEEDSFIIVNEESGQRFMTSRNDAVIELIGIEFKTQLDSTDQGSISMSYDALGNSKLIINDVTITEERSWLLGNFKESSSLEAVNTFHVPNEIYIHDQSNITISGDQTYTGVWFGAEPMTGEITLPNVTSSFDWEVGNGAGLNVGWHLKIINANVGLGLNSFPGSNVIVNGMGNWAELTIGYYVVGGVETLDGLGVGLQNGEISNRLTLNNVNLGAIAWQIYIGENAMLTINNSIVNEIGFFSTSHVVVDNSILQLAVLGVMAPSSTLNIKNSEIWNQEIIASQDSTITITDSDTYGSLLRTLASTSNIAFIRGNFYENPEPCSQNTMIDLVTGQPLCNPFRTPGYPEAIGLGTVTCQNTNNCSF